MSNCLLRFDKFVVSVNSWLPSYFYQDNVIMLTQQTVTRLWKYLWLCKELQWKLMIR
jgi:hypothetical protein